MYIMLGKNEYELDSSAMTLIKYRARYGESFLNLFLKHARISELIPAWERLIYIAIVGVKPRYDVYQEFIKNEGRANDIDELQILALCADLPEYAVSMFCIFDLLKLISQSKGYVSTKKKYRKMSADEIRKLYGG